MKILYECDLAGSKYHGMAYRVFQFGEAFFKQKHDVMVVAASYSHVRRTNPFVSKLLTDEYIDGILYKWIKTPTYKGNGIRRALHMLIYNFRLWNNAKKIAKEFNPDIVIASGVTPLDFVGCKRIAKYANAKIILEIGDLWPLSPIELGGYSKWNPFMMMLQYAENYSYRNADSVVSLLPCAKEYMKIHGLADEKFNYIPNGVILSDWEEIKELPESHLNLLKELSVRGQFLIGYAGAHGIANSLRTIIDSVAILSEQNISLVLLGDGPEKPNLLKYVLEKNYNNVYFLSSVDKRSVPLFLSKMDLLYIGLKKQSLFRFGISPNKMFDYMMAKKPILQAIDAGNNIVEQANCGLYVEPENILAISNAITRIKGMSCEERLILGENGYKFVIENHSYDVLIEHFLKLMNNMIKK